MTSTTDRARRRGGHGCLRLLVRAAGMAGAAVLLQAVGGGLAEADTAPPPAHMFIAGHSGQAMDIPGASHSPGAQLIQWSPHGGDNQLFRALPFTTAGDVHLVIFVNTETGQVLDVNGGTAEGASVVQNPWSGSASQVWWAPPFGDTGYVLFVNMGSGKVATVAGASQTNGAPLVQSAWQGGTNQLWIAGAVIH